MCSIDIMDPACVTLCHRYLSDYNTLESTFLICGIMVLMCGMAYAVASFKNPIYYDLLQYVVLLIVVISTIVCVLTIAMEMVESLKYFARATQANRRMKVRCKVNDIGVDPWPCDGVAVDLPVCRKT